MAHDEQDQTDGWAIYSEWIDKFRCESDTITEYDENSDFNSKLRSCASNIDRFSLIWTDDRLRGELDRQYRDDINKANTKINDRTNKSDEESARMRELGNESFKNNNHLDALKFYTQAVCYAPYPCATDNSNNDVRCNQTMAIALANRSAALFSLRRYRLCLLDIDLALKFNYPTQKKFKLLIRKVKCLHILSVWVNEFEIIKQELRQMMRSNDSPEFVRAEIASMFEFIEQTTSEDHEKDDTDVVDSMEIKITNNNKQLTQAADCVEMSYSSEKGRILITNKDTSYGRLLLSEEPFACLLVSSRREDHCYNCFGKLYGCGLGCRRCTQVLYCSLDCMEANQAIHKYECDNTLDLQDDLGVAYLVLRILFKVDLNLKEFTIKQKKSASRKSVQDILSIEPVDWTELSYNNDYPAVLSLMDHASDFDCEDLMGYTLTAAYLLILIMDKFSDQIETISDKQTQLFMGSIILRHLFQLQTNLISILDQDFQGVVMTGSSLNGVRERPIGVGIYPTISLMNHSCRPNILTIFNRNKLHAHAATGLECGTELNYCYGPSVNRLTKKDRQERLKDQYFFDCNCTCCASDQEDETRALLCPACQGPIVYNLDLTHRCTKCKAEDQINIRESLEKIDQIRSYIDALDLQDEYEEDDMRRLVGLEKALGKLAFWRHNLFPTVKTKLIECAQCLQDMHLAKKYCDEEIELNSKIFGADSYETLMAKMKLLNIRQSEVCGRGTSADNTKDAQSIKELDELLRTVTYIRNKFKDYLTSTNITGADTSFEEEFKFLDIIQKSLIDEKNELSRVAE